MTDQETKWSSFSTWETSVSPLFNVYIKHSYCPEARFLLQPSSVNKSSPQPIGRIITSQSEIIGEPLNLYPPGSYYLHNNIFPVSKMKNSRYHHGKNFSLFSQLFNFIVKLCQQSIFSIWFGLWVQTINKGIPYRMSLVFL